MMAKQTTIKGKKDDLLYFLLKLNTICNSLQIVYVWELLPKPTNASKCAIFALSSRSNSFLGKMIDIQV